MEVPRWIARSVARCLRMAAKPDIFGYRAAERSIHLGSAQ